MRLPPSLRQVMGSIRADLQKISNRVDANSADHTRATAKDANDLLDAALKLVPFYIGYLFLSGWSFNSYYFRTLGLDARYLDISFYDTVVRGVILVITNHNLLIAALLLVAVPILIRVWLHNKPVLTTVLMLGVLGITFYTYRRSQIAGADRASLDQGNNTSLQSLSFKYAGVYRIGRLVYLKGDTYFIHNVHTLDNVASHRGEPPALPQISIFKASELSDVRVVENER
jgi:hypothetical protein